MADVQRRGLRDLDRRRAPRRLEPLRDPPPASRGLMASEVETFVVPDALAGERIDRALALLTGWSRADVQSLVASGAVLVDGEPPTKSRRLTTGAVIDVLAEPDVDAPPTAESVPVDVRYVDTDIIVVHKPAGLVVHP